MIVGAGNAYVAEAKRQLFGRSASTCSRARPRSSSLADATADPELVAADLLGQAEHGPTSPAILITRLARARRAPEHVDGCLARGLVADARSPPRWRDHGRSSSRRPRGGRRARQRVRAEHVEVQVEEARLRPLPRRGCATTARCSSASRRLWPSATRRSGRTTSCPRARRPLHGGLWVGKFLKTVTYQRLTGRARGRIAPAAAAISEAEMFAGHALTARMRLERLGEPI